MQILTKLKIRVAIKKYNKRIALQISDYMGWPEEEVMNVINLMEDNKR